MKNGRDILLQVITAALATLFCYAAVSKLVNYQQSKAEMLRQVFPMAWAEVLTWLIPCVELIVVLLLLNRRTQQLGLWAALLLLSAFTGYIAVVMSGIFDTTPCSCGGILKNMGYGTHLVFNLFFMVTAICGLSRFKFRKSWFYAKEGRSAKSE